MKQKLNKIHKIIEKYEAEIYLTWVIVFLFFIITNTNKLNIDLKEILKLILVLIGLFVVLIIFIIFVVVLVLGIRLFKMGCSA